MMIIVCGVSGTGKSTIGSSLAERLDLPFFDADDFHSEANIEKLTDGLPLDDDDRAPWLGLLASNIAKWAAQNGAVLACSALKESYRQVLASKCREPIQWVTLIGSEELLIARLAARKGHFFNPRLLSSQLDILEVPKYGLQVDITPPPEEIVAAILPALPISHQFTPADHA